MCSKRRADLKGKICGSEAEKSSSSKVLGKPPEIAEIVEISEIAEKAEKAGIVEILPQEMAPQEKATQEISHSISSILGSHLPIISSFSSVLAASTLCCGIASFLPLALLLFVGGRLRIQLSQMSRIRLLQLQ